MSTALNLRSVMRYGLVISLLMPLMTPFASDRQSTKRLQTGPFLQSGPDFRLADFDIRRGQGPLSPQGPTDRQLAALDQMRSKVEGLEIRFNRITGTPRHLFSLSQRLTAPREDDPVLIARSFLKSNQTLFRLSNRQIDDLVVAKDDRTNHNGVAHVVLKQFYQGLDVFQSAIKINIDRKGQVISVSGDYVPAVASTLTPTLSAAEAVRAAARNAFPDLIFSPTLKVPAEGTEKLTRFEKGPFSQDITARLVIFPAPNRARLAWKVRLHMMERLAWFDTLVDAQSGEILFRHNLYQFSGPEGLVFAVNPDLGPQELRSFIGDPIASPQTWVSPVPNTGTQGNNVITLPLAREPGQQFDFPFNDLYAAEGANMFDLDATTLRFTPNGSGGYDVSLLPLNFDSDLGRNLTSRVRPDRDDGFLFLPLGFAFPLFGTSFSSAFINANGNVTFTGGNRNAGESWASMILGSPVIAALWDDLDLGNVPEGGGLFVKREADRVVITWNKVPQFGGNDSNTVQLTLFSNGSIEMAFNGIDLTDGMVGLGRGGEDVDLQPVDFSANDQLTGLTGSLAEKFPTRDLDAVTTNLFYHLNFMHDYLYRLGFDEAAGNFQLDNFHRGGSDSDPVFAAPQHSGFNNAFFAAPEDGQAAFTAYMFFTDPPFRQADSALDADVIYHEYVHGLTGRIIGNRFDPSALFGRQSGAMGEGWSDIYAASITNDPIVGEFSTGNTEVGIRAVNYALSPLVYGDFGNRLGPLSLFGLTGGIGLDKTFLPEVHFDGEIWASTLWDLRTALGKEKMEQLVTDALKFTPSRPSMLDGRDAILIADVASNGGVNQTTIWSVFAARGMGVSARADDGDDTIVFQAFDTPSHPLQPGRETIFFDDMSSGDNGWTVEGEDGNGGPPLWHRSNRRGSAWYYGLEESGTYDTGARNFAALTSPLIDVPSIPRNSVVVLEFDHFMRGDLFSPFFDNGYVRIIDEDSGEMTQKAYVSNNTVGILGGDFFQHEAINISEFAGRSIRIQFYFDTFNEFRNTAEGWFIDNVRVSRRIR